MVIGIKNIEKELSRKNTNYVTYLVHLTDDTLGVWKPYVVKGRYRTELLVSDINKIIGLDLVPEVSETIFEEKEGIVRKYIEGKKGDCVAYRTIKKSELQKLAILDFIIFNCDRGWGNVIITEQGKIYGIDNDATFMDVFGISLNMAHLIGCDLCDEALDMIKVIDTNKEKISDRMKDYGITPSLFQWYERRVNLLNYVAGHVTKMGW